MGNTIIPEILYQTDTSHQIRVEQEGAIRKLMFGHAMCQNQSCIDIQDLRSHIFDYSLLSMYSFLFTPSPSNVLVVGLGGGVIPREIAHYFPDIKVDVIEIDPEVVKIAKDFFFFEETDNIKVYMGDAFNVIKEMPLKYDIIVLDAFSPTYVPFHLMSIEFLQSVIRVSKSESVIVANTCSVHPSFLGQLNTFREAFGERMYYIDGIKNDMVKMLYIPKGDLLMGDVLGLPKEYYPLLKPKSFRFTNIIRQASIFSLRR